LGTDKLETVNSVLSLFVSIVVVVVVFTYTRVHENSGLPVISNL